HVHSITSLLRDTCQFPAGIGRGKPPWQCPDLRRAGRRARRGGFRVLRSPQAIVSKGGAMRRIRRHLTFAHVLSVIALFVALGGTALASVIITNNSQVDRGTISGHHPPSGKHPNIIGGSINGKNIADRSGVDSCKKPLVGKFGPICAGSDGVSRTWAGAL